MKVLLKTEYSRILINYVGFWWPDTQKNDPVANRWIDFPQRKQDAKLSASFLLQVNARVY